VVLSSGETSGSYTSKVFNNGNGDNGNASWNNLSWQGFDYGALEENAEGDLMSGNVLLFHLDESSGTISDSSGNSNDGTDNGGISYQESGKIGKGIGFDGNDDSISVNDDSSISFGDGNDDVPFSISLWFKADSFSNFQGIISKWNAFSDTEEFLVYSNEYGEIRFLIRDSSTDNQDMGVVSGSVSSGFWNHLVVTYSGNEDVSGMKIYINAVEDFSLDRDDAGYLAMHNNNQNLQIGKFKGGDGTNYYFDGAIDEVAIWNRELSTDEVEEIYKKGIVDLNFSFRDCDDENCSGESFELIDSDSESLEIQKNNSYFQYKFDFFSEDSSYSPSLMDVLLVLEILGAVLVVEAPAEAEAVEVVLLFQVLVIRH
jgi:hypothetical protein